MGLDMYLTKKTYVGAQFAHRKAVLLATLTVGDRPVPINPARVSYIEEQVGYWRKANAIHAWFVREIQSGKDECEEYDVCLKDLVRLKQTCLKVLGDPSKAAELLPVQGGFFFGPTDYGDYYADYYAVDLKETIKIVEVLESEDMSEAHLTYRASW